MNKLKKCKNLQKKLEPFVMDLNFMNKNQWEMDVKHFIMKTKNSKENLIKSLYKRSILSGKA